MILLTILFGLLFCVVAVAVTILIVGGSSFIIVFADLLVAALFIAWVIKRVIKKRKAKK